MVAHSEDVHCVCFYFSLSLASPLACPFPSLFWQPGSWNLATSDRLDLPVLCVIAPWRPSTAGDDHSWGGRTRTTEDGCFLIQLTCLSPLVQFPALPFVFSSVAILAFSMLLYLVSKALSFLMTYATSPTWFRRESGGISAAGNLSPSAPFFSLSSSDLTGDNPDLQVSPLYPFLPWTPHRVTLPWYASFVPPITFELEDSPWLFLLWNLALPGTQCPAIARFLHTCKFHFFCSPQFLC